MDHRGNHSVLAAAFIAMFCCLGLSRSPAADSAAPSPGSSAFTDESTKIEGEIASLLGQRGRLNGGQRVVVDFQIDMRIIARWLLRRGADAQDQDQLRDCAALCAMEIQAIAEQLNSRISTASRPLTSTQLDGLSRLHQATYTLGDIKSVKVMDETCRTIALDLILASDPAPADTQRLPPMRPATVRETAGGRTNSSPADYAAKIKSLVVSEPLRRQLDEILSASMDAKQKEEAAGLRDALSTAIGLAESLDRGTGIQPMARPRIEQELIDALALYADVRTRSAGRARMAALDQMRQSLAGVQQVNLPAALREKLGPALVWAGRNPDHGDEVLKLVERDVELSAHFETVKDYASLAANLRRPIEPLVHKYAGEQIRFLQQIGDLDGPSASGILSGLESHIRQMRELLDQIEAIQQLSHAVTVLSAYKPRPGGALDRRATMLLTELGAANSTNHDLALRIVLDCVRLAKAAGALSELSAPAHAVPPEVAKEYTGNLLAAAQAHLPVLIGDLATQLAANKPVDAASFGRLQTYEKLLASLPQAADLEAALAKTDALNHWADWSIPSARLRLMLAPYRNATASAYDGFALDNAGPMEHWLEVRKTYIPLITFIMRDSGYADECSRLPGGLFGELSKLMTPMDGQPFETERYATVAADLWSRYTSSADTRSADAVFSALIIRLSTEQNDIR